MNCFLRLKRKNQSPRLKSPLFRPAFADLVELVRGTFVWLTGGLARLVFSLVVRSAYDVSLVDNSWPWDVFAAVSGGNTSTTWERVDGGGLVSHSLELEAKENGMFAGVPEAYSTPILPLDILADRPPQQKIDWVKVAVVVIFLLILRFQLKWLSMDVMRLLARYGSLVSVISFVVLFEYLISSPSRSSAAKGSKKRR